jgi:hypothetical protein
MCEQYETNVEKEVIMNSLVLTVLGSIGVVDGEPKEVRD